MLIHSADQLPFRFGRVPKLYAAVRRTGAEDLRVPWGHEGNAELRQPQHPRREPNPVDMAAEGSFVLRCPLTAIV
eukprot:scaffold1827_cov421-Prasinococcus_capsulatus_cf.AAC.3